MREHPYRERLRGQLMLALYRTGRQAEALAAYRAARSALVDELGIEPSVELRQLHEAILVQDGALLQTDPGQTAPPPGAGATTDGRAPGHVHLPVQATELIGRERELAELMALADSRRLITLTGTGGTGKTRLGMAFAAGLAERYRTACGGFRWPWSARRGWCRRRSRRCSATSRICRCICAGGPCCWCLTTSSM